MEGANKIEDVSSKVSGSSFMLIFAVFAVVLVIGSAVFFSLQKAAVTGENEKIDAEMDSLRAEISLLEDQKVEAARTAQLFLAGIKDEEILWSRVISRIQSLIPYDGTSQEARVDFLSYSGATGGKINVNAKSRNTTKDPLDDVAEVISVFNDSSYFKNAIVPGITVGENDTGEKSASFAFTMDYTESDADALSAGTDSTVPSDDTVTDAADVPSGGGDTGEDRVPRQ